jgi:circadian clock protein KaiB
MELGWQKEMNKKQIPVSPKNSHKYEFRIYVAGSIGRSRGAVDNLRRLCEREIPGQYQIKVVDVSKDPTLAKENNLIALPVVVRTLPAPVQFIGNWNQRRSRMARSHLINASGG